MNTSIWAQAQLGVLFCILSCFLDWQLWLKISVFSTRCSSFIYRFIFIFIFFFGFSFIFCFWLSKICFFFEIKEQFLDLLEVGCPHWILLFLVVVSWWDMLFFCLNYLVFYITGKNVVFTLFSIFFSRLVDGYERKKGIGCLWKVFLLRHSMLGSGFWYFNCYSYSNLWSFGSCNTFLFFCLLEVISRNFVLLCISALSHCILFYLENLHYTWVCQLQLFHNIFLIMVLNFNSVFALVVLRVLSS